MIEVSNDTNYIDELAPDLPGLWEWRFVPSDWRDPFEHHRHVVVPKGHRAFAEITARLADCPTQTWYGHDGQPTYTAEVSYHPELRPVLVLIGGIR